MLQSVVLQTAVPMELDINSVSPDDIIIIESISGLGAADVTLFTGDFARDGGYYQGRRSSQRNPVFNLKLNPNYKDDIEVSDVRELLYDIFLEPSPTSDELQVVLKDDRKPDRYFIGAVEKFPADIFSRDTKAQISMLCTDPYLKSVDEVTGHNAAGWVSVPVTYSGSKRTGLQVQLKIVAPTSQVVLDVNGVLMTLVKPTGSFGVGDVIVINTLIGSRLITYQGDDVMAMLSAGSKWPELNKGLNTLRVYGTAVADGKVVITDYTYRAAWWGV